MPETQPEKISRVILKISGEYLAGNTGQGYCPDTVEALVDELVEVKNLGLTIGVVLGGGNLFRGATASATGLNRVTADNIGMLATVMNALMVSEALARRLVDAKVFSAIQMDKIVEFYTPQAALAALDKGKICFFCGGTGNPFFTTDTAAVLRAVETKADMVLKGTKVDGVYTADPKTNPNATFIKNTSYGEVLAKELGVMDMTAFSLARDYQLRLKIFNITKPGNVKQAILDKNVGTCIHG